jgi:hypothetical protein
MNAIEKDAERYRWLRKQQWHNGIIAVVLDPKESVKLGRYLPSMELLDSIIDIQLEKDKLKR